MRCWNMVAPTLDAESGCCASPGMVFRTTVSQVGGHQREEEDLQNQIVLPGPTGLPLGRPQAPHMAGRVPQGRKACCLPCVPPAWATVPSLLCLVHGDCGLSQGMMPGHTAATPQPPGSPATMAHSVTKAGEAREGCGWVVSLACVLSWASPSLNKSTASSSPRPLSFCSIPACPLSCSALLAFLSFQSSHVTAFLPRFTHASSRLGLQPTLLLTCCSVPAWGYFIPRGLVLGEGS